MNEDLKKEQYELEGRSELLTEADEKFSIAVATILSLGNNAYQIFQSSKVETKREILHLLLSNLKLQDRKISYTLRKPYDYIKSLNKKIPSKTEGIAIGEQSEPDVEQKSHLNYDLFLAHREEILARKDLTHQLWLMIKSA